MRSEMSWEESRGEMEMERMEIKGAKWEKRSEQGEEG